MRKIICTSMIVLISFLLISCSVNSDNNDISATVSFIQVTDKGGTEGEYWILAVYPDKIEVKREMKIIVGDKNVWNLIEIDRKYTAHYAKRDNGSYYLYEIESM